MPELLIVGGLTIDRFADGRTAPGGSVLHAGRAAAAEGVAPTFLTVAGDEREARAGTAMLAELGTLICQPASATATYRHEESDGRRVLVYETATDRIRSASLAGIASPDIVLVAPIADEVPAAVVLDLCDRHQPSLSVLLIQGWLRRLVPGAATHPLRLDELSDELWASFAKADVIVVSTEDLAESPEDPFTQAATLRAALGPAPILVLTLGPEGYLLDDPSADRIRAAMPRRVVTDVPTVGAGDTFGAAMALHLARGDGPVRAADAASDRVIRTLESRR